jgi:hypothetical protein
VLFVSVTAAPLPLTTTPFFWYFVIVVPVSVPVADAPVEAPAWLTVV